MENIKLVGAKVVYNNVATPDGYGKHGLTIKTNIEELEVFTNVKTGGIIKCSGKPADKNIFLLEDQTLEAGDIVDVLVAVETYEDNVYPKLLAIRQTEKSTNAAEAPSYEGF